MTSNTDCYYGYYQVTSNTDCYYGYYHVTSNVTQIVSMVTIT